MAFAIVQQNEYTPEKINLITRTIAKGATPDELELFIAQCVRTGLDPFARQIFCVERWGRGGKQMVTQTSIDGFRLIAERTGNYEGQTQEYWCGPNGVWRDIWLEKTPPAGARVGVYKKGCREPIWAVVTFAEYAGRGKEGKLIPMWEKMPSRMLLKCAESLALRKAFPQELSGLYTAEEMSQADSSSEPMVAVSAVAQLPASQKCLSQNQINQCQTRIDLTGGFIGQSDLAAYACWKLDLEDFRWDSITLEQAKVLVEAVEKDAQKRIDDSTLAIERQDLPTEGALILPTQLQSLQIELKKMGFKDTEEDRKERNSLLSWMVKHPLTSSKELTMEEAKIILTRIKSGDPSELVADWAAARDLEAADARGAA